MNSSETSITIAVDTASTLKYLFHHLLKMFGFCISISLDSNLTQTGNRPITYAKLHNSETGNSSSLIVL